MLRKKFILYWHYLCYANRIFKLTCPALLHWLMQLLQCKEMLHWHYNPLLLRSQSMACFPWNHTIVLPFSLRSALNEDPYNSWRTLSRISEKDLKILTARLRPLSTSILFPSNRKGNAFGSAGAACPKLEKCNVEN